MITKAGHITGLAGVLAVLATGCGADSRPSHADFEAKVRNVCAATQARHDAAAKGFDFESFDPNRSDLSSIVPVIERNVEIGREAARALTRIRGPQDDEAKVRRFVATAKRMHKLGDAEARAARQGDRAAFKKLIAQEDALQQQLGNDPILKGC